HCWPFPGRLLALRAEPRSLGCYDVLPREMNVSAASLCALKTNICRSSRLAWWIVLRVDWRIASCVGSALLQLTHLRQELAVRLRLRQSLDQQLHRFN